MEAILQKRLEALMEAVVVEIGTFAAVRHCGGRFGASFVSGFSDPPPEAKSFVSMQPRTIDKGTGETSVVIDSGAYGSHQAEIEEADTTR